MPVEMPEELTAENGAKALMIGEFEEEIPNPTYCDCGVSLCPMCEITQDEMLSPTMKVQVSWDTIKKIYKKLVRNRRQLLENHNPVFAALNAVVKRTNGTKFIVKLEPYELRPGEEIVADRPHGDGDFSYCCGVTYCRCGD